jgi:hypothetical protein
MSRLSRRLLRRLLLLLLLLLRPGLMWWGGGLLHSRRGNCGKMIHRRLRTVWPRALRRRPQACRGLWRVTWVVRGWASILVERRMVAIVALHLLLSLLSLVVVVLLRVDNVTT